MICSPSTAAIEWKPTEVVCCWEMRRREEKREGERKRGKERGKEGRREGRREEQREGERKRGKERGKEGRRGKKRELARKRPVKAILGDWKGAWEVRRRKFILSSPDSGR